MCARESKTEFTLCSPLSLFQTTEITFHSIFIYTLIRLTFVLPVEVDVLPQTEQPPIYTVLCTTLLSNRREREDEKNISKMLSA